jgi:general secretion pathway protein G
MKIRTRRRRNAGFSLAEMMVVIVILGLLATLVVPNVIDHLNRAMVQKAKTDIGSIAKALDSYAIANGGRYPESLEALVTPDVNGMTFLDQRSVPEDPWKAEYMYEAPHGSEPRPRVSSYGKDVAPGGEGVDADLSNFTLRDD